MIWQLILKKPSDTVWKGQILLSVEMGQAASHWEDRSLKQNKRTAEFCIASHEQHSILYEVFFFSQIISIVLSFYVQRNTP